MRSANSRIVPPILFAVCLLCCAANAPAAPDPFTRPADPQDRQWREAALAMLFSWHDAFIKMVPSAILFPDSIPYLETSKAYSAFELKQIMRPEDWDRYVINRPGRCKANGQICKSEAEMEPSANAVFVNPPDLSGSHDLLGNAATISNLYLLPFSVDTKASALAEYRWFVNDRQTLDSRSLPRGMREFLDRYLRQMIANLPRPAGAKAKRVSVQYDQSIDSPNQNSSFIWASSRLTPTPHVTLSPLLLRTLFLVMSKRCFPIELKYMWPREDPSLAADARGRLTRLKPESILRCFDRFAESVSPVLAHELGHWVLAPEGAALSTDEDCANSFAIAYVQTHVSESLEVLTTWKSLLAQFDAPEAAAYFGLDDTQDVGARRAQLKSFQRAIDSGLQEGAPRLTMEAALSCVLTGSAQRP